MKKNFIRAEMGVKPVTASLGKFPCSPSCTESNVISSGVQFFLIHSFHEEGRQLTAIGVWAGGGLGLGGGR